MKCFFILLLSFGVLLIPPTAIATNLEVLKHPTCSLFTQPAVDPNTFIGKYLLDKGYNFSTFPIKLSKDLSAKVDYLAKTSAVIKSIEIGVEISGTKTNTDPFYFRTQKKESGTKSLFVLESDIRVALDKEIPSCQVTPTDDQTLDELKKYTVSITGVNGNNLCGGIAISPTSILTASHCISNTDSYRIQTYSKDGTLITKRASVAIKNPRYQSKKGVGDLAILKIDGALELNFLPMGNEEEAISNFLLPESKCYQLGTLNSGHLSKGKILADTSLMESDVSFEGELTIKKDFEILVWHPLVHIDGSIDLEDYAYSVKVEHGDSGSPIVCLDNFGNAKLIGILTGRLNEYFRTSVPVFQKMNMDWIQQNI